MMKILQFTLSAATTVLLVFALNNKIGSVPPLGKFLDPFKGFWANAENEPEILPKLDLAGLESPVAIEYDDMLVPHIFADNENDLYFTVGYVHAFHRLWQMEFQTHAAAGRLSEIVGEVTLDMDRGMRRKGMTFGAENFINNLDPHAEEIINHYTQGINAYINSLEYADYPLEYKILDYQPEAWSPLKSGLLYKYMADMLNTGERDLENTNFRSIYGKELLDLIYPDIDNYDDPVVEKQGNWDLEPVSKNDGIASHKLNETAKIDKLPGPNLNNGSNNWAIGPEKSALGYPILCNDPHLKLYLPSLWYYMQQNAPGVNVYGQTLPGIPFVISGFTDSIAWGLTNAQRDLVDWYKIEFEDDSRNNYLLDGSFVPTIKKIEEFAVRGSETYHDTVVYTIFGPVTYDQTYRSSSGKNGYAYRWIDHEPSPGFAMFYSINRAKNFDDYMEALDNFTSPAQNIVFASVHGDIAIRVQGKFPVNDFEEGKYLKDGTASENMGTEFIPMSHNVFSKNPKRGFVSSANQQPADAAYPYYVHASQYESYRNRRINDVLNGDTSVTIEDMINLQYDNYSLKAEEALPFMLDQLRGAELSVKAMDVIEQLKSWDYFYDADSKPAVYFEIWFSKLFSAIWDEISKSKKENIELAYPSSFSTIRLLKENPDLSFFDLQSTKNKEDARDMVILAFREMIAELELLKSQQTEISLATYKRTFVGHQSRLKPLGKYDIITGGNGKDVVNATGSNHGPSHRMIVELDPKGIRAWGHYPGGQSGNPGSKYYDNMIDAWANKQYFELLFMTGPQSASDRIIFSQTLLPAK